jgi:hypothetical protein
MYGGSCGKNSTRMVIDSEERCVYAKILYIYVPTDLLTYDN